jgi:hypothetical protein
MTLATLVDEFLPVYDVSDAVATVVEADARTTWDALIDADLIEVGRQRPLVALLGAVRILPDLVWQRLHGEHPPATPARLTLRGTTELPMSSVEAPAPSATIALSGTPVAAARSASSAPIDNPSAAIR